MKNKNKIKSSYKYFSIVSVAFLSLYSLTLVYPLIWALISSFKGRFDFRENIFGLPNEWIFENYKIAFESLRIQITAGAGVRYVYFGEQILNSVLIAVGCTFVNVASTCVVAYIVAKYDCKVSRFIYQIVIVTLILPIVGTLAPTLLMLRRLNLYDTYLGGLVLKSGFLGTDFLMIYAVYKGISWDYAEAAQIDGAGHFLIFFKIMIPLAKGTIFALSLLAFIGFWNSYELSLMYMPSMPNLSYGLFYFQTAASNVGSVPVQLAGSLVTTLPMLLVFILFKKQLIGNLAIGGLKG